MRLLLSAAANFLIDISATFQLTYTIADNGGDHDFRSLFAENQHSHPEQDHFFAQGGCFIQIY